MVFHRQLWGAFVAYLLFVYFLPHYWQAKSLKKSLKTGQNRPVEHYMSDVKYSLIAQEAAVEVVLDANESVLASGGAMIYYEAGIKQELTFSSTKKTTGITDIFKGAWERLLSDERLGLELYNNPGDGHVGDRTSKRVAFASPKKDDTVIAINLSHPDVASQNVRCREGAFLAGVLNVSFSLPTLGPKDDDASTILPCTQDCERGLGQRQEVQGDGMVFLHARGYHHNITLEKGSSLFVDRDCLVAYTTNLRHRFTYFSFETLELVAYRFVGIGKFGSSMVKLEVDDKSDSGGTVWVQSICDKSDKGQFFYICLFFITWRVYRLWN